MAFGNNSFEKSTRKEPASNGDEPKDLREIMQQRESGGGNKGFVIAGVAFCLFAFSAPLAYSHFSGGAMFNLFGPPLPYDAKYLANEPKPVARTYSHIGLFKKGSFGATAVKFSMESTDKVENKRRQLTPIDSVLFEKCHPKSRELRNDTLVRGFPGLDVRKAAPKYLSCLMKTLKSRLCESKYRTRLAKDLRAFLRQQKTYNVAVKQMMSNPMAQHAMKMTALVKGEKTVKRSYQISEGLTKSLGNDIRNLSKVGLLSEDDFGFLGPDESIKPYLVAQEKRVCN